MTLKTVTFSLGAVVAATAVLAHSGATGIVKQRMDAMDAMGDVIKRIAPMFQGELGYDAGAVRAAAETFRSHAGAAMTELFPEGSNAAPSEAKESIWTDWDDFAALAEQLATYSEGLALAAENGLAKMDGMDPGVLMGGGSMMGGSMMGGDSGMAGMMGGGVEHLAQMPANAVFEMVSQTCSACHTRFRVDK